ncbi:class I adenylate-forming enzyme family protein [Variovorax sp. RT4R15]|uniref:class I adenylate-forming enzyme family protein n=1 Tax=Variovorax sp. RT4R15 TaxID=3443737 RepID=UPI003F471A60
MSPTRIHQPFDAWLAACPDEIFVHERERSLSYAALGALVDRAQAELQGDGVRTGDRVLIVAENCAEHVALIFACSRIGAWSCGVNARMAPGEIAAIVAKADPRIVYFTSAVSDAAARHAQQHGARASALTGLSRSPVHTEAVAETGAQAQEIAALIFTSGTTGTPKGVLVTHDGLLHFGRVSAQSRALGREDRSYAYLPMTHIFGLGTVLMASLHAGAGLVMRSTFSPEDVLDALARHGVSNLQGPPTLFSRLLAHMDAQCITEPVCPQLRLLYTGAGPLDMALKTQVEARFRMPLHHGYGLSEYAGSLHVTRLDEWRSDTSAGYPLEGAELRIVDANGADLPMGQRGEIWMRGRGLMPGYFRDEAATRQVMRSGGWYASGDLGEFAQDGALFVVGRLKEMIIRSGFNVYPGEVEAVLNAFPAIQRSAVVGQCEADGNEQVLAYVELRQGERLDPAALEAFVRDRLSPYKRPSRVQAVDHLPTTLSGKLLKRNLLALYPPA